MKRNCTLIQSIIILILTAFSVFASSGKYTRNIELKAVKCTVDNIQEILTEIYNYTLKVNTKSNETSGYVRFKSEKYASEFDLPFTSEKLKRIPKKVTDLYFRISSSSNNIDGLTLVLSDRSRSVEISGESYDHVTGLVSIVKDKLSPYETFWGGPRIRLLLGFVFFITFLGLYSIITFRYQETKIFVVSLVVMIVIPNAVVHFPPWDVVFPGCLISNEKLFFLEKYAHVFTFLGFIIALIPIIIWMIKLAANKRLKEDEQ